MDYVDESIRRRIVGDYIIGTKIGTGSFSVVYRARHRHSGIEFAVKEIDKKNLHESLLKEISILKNINHPNIIRLFEAIETEERIYIVLEYCDGGDLGAYINRNGRVTEDVAKHFMKQLAAGLQVLRENHLIHRDLKPQNLLLTSKDMTSSMKIADFGFARYLTQGLADTLCGSPLYMAPEIMQNQKYDAKADLWSVGAILYQLVVGRPPFHGNSQIELFKNVMTSDLKFPEGTLTMLDPDFVDLCRRLLRRNPIERLSFEEFFDHQFLGEPRRLRSINEEKIGCSSGIHEHVHSATTDQLKRPITDEPTSSNQSRGAASLDSIGRGYVFIHSQFASMETLTSSLERTMLHSSSSKAITSAQSTDQHVSIEEQRSDLPASSASGTSNASSVSGSANILVETQGLSVLNSSARLHLLDQYIRNLSDLAQQKSDAGMFLESVSIEFVVLAIWRKAISICDSWLGSAKQRDPAGESSGNRAITTGSLAFSLYPEENNDLNNPSSASAWAESGFVAACERAEKLQKYLQDAQGTTVPDAMELIYQTALDAGRSGGADECMEKWDSAAELYSKSMLLLAFILDAPSLTLNPPFVLAPDNEVRIQKFIKVLQPRWARCNMPSPASRPSSLSGPK